MIIKVAQSGKNDDCYHNLFNCSKNQRSFFGVFKIYLDICLNI